MPDTESEFVLDPIGEVEREESSRRLDKQRLVDEVGLRIDLELEGVRFKPAEIHRLSLSVEEADLLARGENLRLPLAPDQQASIYLPHGIHAKLRLAPRSPYQLKVEEGSPVLYGPEGLIGEVELLRRHRVLKQKISTGERFEQIGSVNPEGGLRVAFSNECSLKDTGEDCLFCAFNANARNSNGESVFLKTPRQVAETFALAYKEGSANHLNLTGGFIPERRELEYYLDVADEIRAHTGLEKFRATAVIGAPADLSVIEKYKEAGFTSVAIDIEIWNKDIFKAICPGKEKRNGGWAHWVAALEHAVSVFGRGRVMSNIVAGLEPKDSILEGVEYLASKGVVCLAGPFVPHKGTALEGHRSPEASWHLDLLQKIAAILHKHGFMNEHVYGPVPGRPVHELFRIQGGEIVDGKLARWRYAPL